MRTPLYQIELLEFRTERGYASVRVQKLDNGLTSEWWVSHNSGTEIRVGACLNIPLFGETLSDGERRCRLMAEEVIDFASWAGGGGAGVAGSSDEYRRAHAKKHLLEQKDFLGAMSATEYTAVLYSFALQFNINNPAALIAQVEVLPSVRTIHDRLAHARRKGLLDSPGKGNKRKKEEDGPGNDNGYDLRTEVGEDYGDSSLERYAKRNPTIFD